MTSTESKPFFGSEVVQMVEAILHAMPQTLVSFIDSQKKYQFVNDSYLRWFNRSRGDVLTTFIWSNESETFTIIEKFNCSFCHFASSSS